jgi:hypothetical protein
VEVDFLRMGGRVGDSGNGEWGYEDTSRQDDALFYSVLSWSIENPSGGRAST